MAKHPPYCEFELIRLQTVDFVLLYFMLLFYRAILLLKLYADGRAYFNTNIKTLLNLRPNQSALTPHLYPAKPSPDQCSAIAQCR